MKYTYTPTGTCSREMQFEVTDGKVFGLKVIGGCHGNLQGIAALVEGMPVDEVVSRLRGLRCRDKATSCPDQFACALQQAANNID